MRRSRSSGRRSTQPSQRAAIAARRRRAGRRIALSRQPRVELERLAASLRDWGAQVTTRAVWGVPAYEAILTAARAWAADLLVVGTHVRETLHTRLTDTDWQLMRRAACPLLLVKTAIVQRLQEDRRGRGLGART